jgi:hypothetical protein
MAQVVSHRPVPAEARVHLRVNPCGIYSWQSGTGTGFSPSSSVFPCQYHSTVALQTRITWGMCNMLTSVGIHAWVWPTPPSGEKTRGLEAVWKRCVQFKTSGMHIKSFINIYVILLSFYIFSGGISLFRVWEVYRHFWISISRTAYVLLYCWKIVMRYRPHHAIDYRLDDRGSIPGRYKGFFL